VVKIDRDSSFLILGDVFEFLLDAEEEATSEELIKPFVLCDTERMESCGAV
jgi:hypothetical protein